MRLSAVTLFITGALLSAGCGGSDGAPNLSATPTLPTSTQTPKPTLSPSRTGPLTSGPNVKPGETPPALNDFAKQHNSAGALAFATYFIKALDWSLATSDPYLLQQISAPSCKSCAAYISRLSQVRTAGQSVVGGRFSIGSARLRQGAFRFHSDYIVEMDLIQNSLSITGPGATSPSPISHSTRFVSRIYVSWINDRWQIIEQGGS